MQVDLTMPATLRWDLSGAEETAARGLLAVYQRDLGLPAPLVAELSRPTVRADYWAEMEGIALRAGIPIEEVVCGNLYYDALKAVLVGCTAFAVDTPTGPLHARNLDWWSENDSLRRNTIQTKFVGAPVGEFTTVGWPGFVGALSGIAPYRFAITLNAVISDEPLQVATPVVFALRQVLEEADCFESALRTLRTISLASDSLLLLTGVHRREMAVIERTPTRAEVRFAENGCIFVTNDYRKIHTGLRSFESELQSTTCGRYDRISDLVASRVPRDVTGCLNYLNDPAVRMGITVQQMVFHAATGTCLVQ
jgi:Acyl-coenzyme A:6-aminopenicillanic acid acyl-transferase